jgi:hypothetical protein
MPRKPGAGRDRDTDRRCRECGERLRSYPPPLCEDCVVATHSAGWRQDARNAGRRRITGTGRAGRLPGRPGLTPAAGFGPTCPIFSARRSG